MIYDLLTEWRLYRDLGSGVQEAFEYLSGADLLKMADGRHDIDGERIFLLLSSYSTEPESRRQFESHRRYLDVQILLQGAETLYWAPVTELAAPGEYSEEKDVLFYQGPAAGGSPAALPLRPGRFALLFPQDGHKPGCLAGQPGGGPQRVRKAVLKIRI